MTISDQIRVEVAPLSSTTVMEPDLFPDSSIVSSAIGETESASFEGTPSLLESDIMLKSQMNSILAPSGSNESLASNIAVSPALM